MTDLTSTVYKDAEIVYNYNRISSRLSPPTSPASAIFCLCSLDTRVAAYAASLYLSGIAPFLIFSGSSGALTEGLFDAPEAVVFAHIAESMGVPSSAIIVEPRATNTGENVRFTHALLQEKDLSFKKLLLVQKPYMERRTYATFVKQWPGGGVDFEVTSPPVSWEDYPDEKNPRELVASIMVGDLVRIREYPSLGYQIEQDIPGEVWDAGQRLIKAGYNKHLP